MEYLSLHSNQTKGVVSILDTGTNSPTRHEIVSQYEIQEPTFQPETGLSQYEIQVYTVQPDTKGCLSMRYKNQQSNQTRRVVSVWDTRTNSPTRNEGFSQYAIQELTVQPETKGCLNMRYKNHETFTKCRFLVGPQSVKQAQHLF